MANIERFVLNTGRSGSNMLTRMLAQNRHMMILSDFFVCGDNLDRFPEGPVSGERFATYLSAINDIGTLLARRAFGMKEQLYAAEKQGSRWRDPSRMPSMLAAPLAFLSKDPETLFDEVQAFARSQPTRSFPDQCHALFSWFMARYEKKAWIERSGSNLRFIAGLRRTFPNARYLHLNRDGIEASMSAREHNYFKLAVEYDERLPSLEELEQAICHLALDETDPVTRLLQGERSLEPFGRHWMRQICAGFREFVHLRPEQYMEVRYEDILAHPERELTRIAAFFEMPDDPGWEERAAATIDSNLGRRPASSLSPDEYERIATAVLPGQILLGRADPYHLEHKAYPRLREAFDIFDRGL